MKKITVTAFLLIQIYILTLLIFAGSTDHYIKRPQLYPNTVYAAAGLILTAVLCFIILKGRTGFERTFITHEKMIVAVTIAVFFAFSVFLCISGFFFSDWDPEAILYGVYGVLHGRPEDTGTVYFSNHPNNLLLVWIYLSVLRTAGIFGTDSVLCLVVFQCILSAFSALVFYRILADMTNDPFASYAVLIVYGIWIMLSPWFIITYSDEAGIIIPLLILRLYQMGAAAGSAKTKRILCWTVMSALAAFGYFIKPQIILSYIAIMILCILCDADEAAGQRLLCISCAVVTLALSVIIIKALIIPSLGIETDTDKSFGMAHYFMMGLNDATDGVYSDDDTLYTDSFDTPSEKREADLKLAKERIRAYGFWGLMDHAKNKTLVNYNDGLFAWGVDGHFFAERALEGIGEVPETAATVLIWSFIKPEGSNHGKYSAFEQMIWLTVLILDLIAGVMLCRELFAGKEKQEPQGNDAGSGIHTRDIVSSGNAIYAVLLTLTFLFVFELLFEAKARYLFIYTPYYLLAAVYGLWGIMRGIGKSSKDVGNRTSDGSGE